MSKPTRSAQIFTVFLALLIICSVLAGIFSFHIQPVEAVGGLPTTTTAHYVTASNATNGIATQPNTNKLTFYDGQRFWAIFYNNYTREFWNVTLPGWGDLGLYNYTYVIIGSEDGATWGPRYRWGWGTFTGFQYFVSFNTGPNFVKWDSATQKGYGQFPPQSLYGTGYFIRFNTTDGIFNIEAQKGGQSIANYYEIAHSYGYTTNQLMTYWQGVFGAGNKRDDVAGGQNWTMLDNGFVSSTLPAWGSVIANVTGESKVMTWNATHAIYVTVGGDYKLYWNYYAEDGASVAITAPPVIMSDNGGNVTVSPGHDSLAGSSEPELSGFGVGTDDIVYRKSTQQLATKRFNGTGWSDELVLVDSDPVSNATYPTLVTGHNGNRWIFYIRNNTIQYKKYNVFTEEIGSETALCPDHTFDNPTWLNSNQFVQGDYASLIWTENGNDTAIAPSFIWHAALQVEDEDPPTASDKTISTNLAGAEANFSIKVTDTIGLSHYIVSTNISGQWVNSTAVPFESNPQTLTFTLTLPSTPDTNTSLIWYFNDTEGNWGTTSQTVTTLAVPYNPGKPPSKPLLEITFTPDSFSTVWWNPNITIQTQFTSNTETLTTVNFVWSVKNMDRESVFEGLGSITNPENNNATVDLSFPTPIDGEYTLTVKTTSPIIFTAEHKFTVTALPILGNVIQTLLLTSIVIIAIAAILLHGRGKP